MSNHFKNFMRENLTGILLGLGATGFAGLVLHDTWETEQERHALLDKIAAADVTKAICPSEKPPTDLLLTLSPLLEMEDRTTHKSAEDFLHHVITHGISFAFCPVAQGTTSFEVAPDSRGQYVSVLKISDQATAQQQQAAVLQFLKEYKSASVSIHYNNVVQADPGLTRVMPGRLPTGTNVKDHDLGQYGLTLNVPFR